MLFLIFYPGVPQLNALVFVQIHIKDINNYAPVFTQTQSYKKSVLESEEIGECIKALLLISYQINRRKLF